MNSAHATLDEATFENLVAITGGDIAFVDELIDTYLEDGEEQLAAMSSAAAADDFAGLVRPAHSLKGAQPQRRAAALAELCRMLEVDARSGSVPNAEDRLEATAREFAAVRGALLAARESR